VHPRLLAALSPAHSDDRIPIRRLLLDHALVTRSWLQNQDLNQSLMRPSSFVSAIRMCRILLTDVYVHWNTSSCVTKSRNSISTTSPISNPIRPRNRLRSAKVRRECSPRQRIRLAERRPILSLGKSAQQNTIGSNECYSSSPLGDQPFFFLAGCFKDERGRWKGAKRRGTSCSPDESFGESP
jgi:hypothetical protein